ncbi:ester hydrolase C11orf54 homolog isoform X3 [Chiloscyllium plagiosum]|uniref:ester hydrolase C11orf54 homolog isoform X3 n=1 Tax=Chiloscyllium plagiosum TaxID=36176 RepID=UPI001CB80D81|nr:ester hydrolase C11orf54 homolog isoform X3 [Chiloscyllium plagiosum]
MAARIEKSAFHVPTLQELGQVLQGGLKKNFANVQVSVVDCPDLTQEPFTFAAAGICGKPRIADVGGVDYLLPLPQTEKIYNLNVIANQVELPGGFILGAGAASFKAMGVNAEVIEVRSSRRTGQSNFVSCMRETLEQHYGDKSVGMGGTFLIQTGKAKLHVMPEFSPCPLNSNEAVNNWLKFFDMSAPLISQSVFVSRDLGFDLRLEHTHCFSHHGEGGHYHYDTTPDNVEYLGYFVPAEYLYRIDRPEKTLKIGRD